MTKKLKCPQCPKTFKTIQYLKQHCSSIHGGITDADLQKSQSESQSLADETSSVNDAKRVGLPQEQSADGVAIPLLSPTPEAKKAEEKKVEKKTFNLSGLKKFIPNFYVNILSAKVPGWTMSRDARESFESIWGEFLDMIGLDINVDAISVDLTGKKGILAMLAFPFVAFPLAFMMGNREKVSDVKKEAQKKESDYVSKNESDRGDARSQGVRQDSRSDSPISPESTGAGI